jgi:glyoxylase-like metal-dependent hydrolase (beta-lactamase superfamily II)
MEFDMEFQSIKLRYTNCYLIRHQGGFLLIDTGYDYEWDRFVEGLARLGIGPGDISHMILTHHHDDHCGLLNRLTVENPSIVVIMSALTALRLEGGVHVFKRGAGYVTRRIRFLVWIKSRMEPTWTHSFPPYHARPRDRIIEAPMRLSDLGLDLEGSLLATPGHTEDSLSLVMDEGTCFCGDAVANFMGFAGAHYCVIFIEDIREYYQSWDRLLTAGARVLCPAHGKPFQARRLRENHGRHRRLTDLNASDRR